MIQSLNKLVNGLVPPDIMVPDIAVSGLNIHSDNIVPGDVFIAVPGFNTDGHDFVNVKLTLTVLESMQPEDRRKGGGDDERAERGARSVHRHLRRPGHRPRRPQGALAAPGPPHP